MDDSLKSLNLYRGNVGDQLAGKYSGGMKRRLSVGISLIGDTQVCPLSNLLMSLVRKKISIRLT